VSAVPDATEVEDCAAVFARVAAAQPDNVAVIEGTRHTSFAELDAEVEHRSRALTAAGLGAGQRVALIAESSGAFLATALAVWRARGVLVTVYPSSGPEDLAYAIESSDAALIVVGDGVDRAVVEAAAGSTPVVGIDPFVPTRVRASSSPGPSDVREPLSLICFSSGTTSRPKAIMVSARTVLNCAQTYAEVWHLGPADRGVICLPMAWMYGLASTSLALLLSGATAVVVPRARPGILVEAIAHNEATFLAGVTTTFTKLVQHTRAEQLPGTVFASLRLCISGGEPRNETAFDAWRSLTGVAVLDAYCSSECLPLVTYDPWVDPVPHPGSAGRLVPRARLKVVGPDGVEVSPGEVGEALSSGPGLMLGYWRDPELTREAITDDGWYRTKDLVRVDADGYVYVVGRLSDLIIRGGVNISPAEVERVVRLHPSVADAAVVGLPDEVYGERVVAAVTAEDSLDTSELDQLVRSHLSSYKVPSEYVLLDRLPVNATTGKVDRRRLAERLSERGEAAR
jgi:long-chain acyl-CoA synthetase